MSFIHEDFLLTTKTARRLYHQFAEDRADSGLPLPPAAARTSRRTGGSRTCSRSGWKATTTSGGPCAPTACRSASAPATPTPFEKFQAWARTVPHTLRNPLYHWTHLELKRYFGIDELLDEAQRAAHLGAGQRATGDAGAERARHPRTSSR